MGLDGVDVDIAVGAVSGYGGGRGWSLLLGLLPAALDRMVDISVLLSFYVWERILKNCLIREWYDECMGI